MVQQRTVQQRARALAKAEGIKYTQALRRLEREASIGREPSRVGLEVLLDGEPLVLDLDTAEHVFIAGRPGAGKSTVLATAARGLMAAPQPVEVLVCDPITNGVSLQVDRSATKVATAGTDIAALVDIVRDEVVRRQGQPPSEHRQLVLIYDEVGGLCGDTDLGRRVLGALAQIARSGVDVGVSLLWSSQSASGAGGPLADTHTRLWLGDTPELPAGFQRVERDRRGTHTSDDDLPGMC